MAVGLLLVAASVRSYSTDYRLRADLEAIVRETIEANQALPAEVIQKTRAADALLGITYSAGKAYISQQIVIGDGTPISNSTIHHGFVLAGAGSGANEGELAGMPSGTELVWIGPPTTAPMIHVRGPIHSVKIRDFAINCQKRCSGIQLDHTVDATVERVAIRNVSRNGFGILQQSTNQPRPGMAIGAGGNSFDRVRVLLTEPGDGFILGAADARGGSSSNHFKQVSVLCSGTGTTGFRLRHTDYIRLVMAQTQYCERSVYADPPFDHEGFPTAIYFYEPAFDKEPTYSSRWKPYPNSGFIFANYHREWDGRAPWMDSSYGPPMPKHRDIWGTDNTKPLR